VSKAGFGEHLKREREMRGVSLEEICAATRISTRFLEALESETWEQLPGGVFNRGFVRAVARFLGLDEDSLVAECAEAMKQSGVAIEGPSPHGTRLGPKPGEGRSRWWIGAAAILLVVAAAWLGWRWFTARRAERNAAPRVAAAMPPSDESASAGAPAAPSTPGSAAGPASSSSETQPASDMLQLKIEAGKATALTVTADGATVFDGGVIAGQSRSFEAEIEFKVTVEDAGAILMELNGQTLPPAGPPGHSGNVTLSRRDLKPAGGFD